MTDAKPPGGDRAAADSDEDSAAEYVTRTGRPCTSGYPPLPLSDNQLDAAVDAAGHLFVHDLPPLFDLATIRALWRRGDRALATTLARLRGVA